MARHPTEAGARIYAAAQQFIERCLQRDDSLFTPGRPVWSARSAQELKVRFVDQPDESADSFMEKLQRQLKGGSRDAIQLLAETLYVYFLLAHSVKGSKKRATINKVLSWAPTPIEIPEDLAATLDVGVCNAGMSFNAHRPFFLWQLITFTLDWKALDDARRRELLGDPWAFKEFVFGNEVPKAFGQRHALLHVVHPDTFEAIVSGRHKRKLAAAFLEHVDDDSEDVDRQILQIREALQAEQAEPVKFYSPAIRAQWLDVDDVAVPAGPKPRDPAGITARLLPDAAQRRAVLDALARSIEHAHARSELCWSLTLQRRLIRLNVGPLRVFDIKAGTVDAAVVGSMAEEPARRTPGVDLLPEPFKTIPEAQDVHIEAPSFGDSWPSVVEAHRELINMAAARSTAPWARSHSTEFITYLSEAVGRQLPTRPRAGAKGGEEATTTEGTDAALSDLEEKLMLEEGSLERVNELLAHKRQVIFHGPPGTGKTYIARKLAQHLAADGGRVEIVQFHPSYAYEDFVEGFRPTLERGQAGFALVAGPLKRLAQDARANPKAKFVLLIDELNRGNLAKVFGELYFLLEYRDEAISLQYSREPFSLPPNLLLIGTMNTADRSIALVDLALRRRFHFVPFFPDRSPIKGVLRQWLAANTPEMEWVADVVDRANSLIEDRHVAIGHSHFMHGDMDEDWVAMVWEHSVLPYLEEQFFGQEERLKEFQLDRLRAVGPAASQIPLADRVAESADVPGSGS